MTSEINEKILVNDTIEITDMTEGQIESLIDLNATQGTIEIEIETEEATEIEIMTNVIETIAEGETGHQGDAIDHDHPIAVIGTETVHQIGN